MVIGDVVGLGKTLMATTLARIFEDDHGVETLIICPKNLVRMWENYRQEYRLRAKVLSITQVQRELPDLRRFRLVLIDESHLPFARAEDREVQLWWCRRPACRIGKGSRDGCTTLN